jgi:hypothetical protein
MAAFLPYPAYDSLTHELISAGLNARAAHASGPVITCGEALFKQLHPLKFIEHEHVLLIELRAHDDPAVHRGVVAKGW